jgi:hypothetical protein
MDYNRIIKWSLMGISAFVLIVLVFVFSSGSQSTAREVDIRVLNNNLQWQYTGDETWTSLFDLATLRGQNGTNGLDGEDGRELSFRVTDLAIEYQFEGETVWSTLVPLSALRGQDGVTPSIGVNGNWFIGTTDTGVSAQGPAGATGSTGATGAVGPQGPQGNTGAQGVSVTNVEFKEVLNLNIDSYLDFDIYTDDFDTFSDDTVTSASFTITPSSITSAALYPRIEDIMIMIMMIIFMNNFI